MKKFANIIGWLLTFIIMVSGIYVWRSHDLEAQEYDKLYSEKVFEMNNKFYLLNPDSGESQEVGVCKHNGISIYMFRAEDGLHFYPREYRDGEWITVREDDARLQDNPCFENETMRYFVPQSCNAIMKCGILTPAKFDWSMYGWVATSIENSYE